MTAQLGFGFLRLSGLGTVPWQLSPGSEHPGIHEMHRRRFCRKLIV